MAAWGWMAVGYALFMAIVATTRPVTRRAVALAASLLFGVSAAAVSTLGNVPALVVLPGALALAAYWLSGLFVGQPQSWLERWLLAGDDDVFRRWRINEQLEAAPRWVLEVLEFGYSTVYLSVMAGAVAMAPLGRDALTYYWTVVLPSEFICYAALPFLRCRPPRSLEGPGVIACRAPAMRRLNDQIVGRGSIQVNTIPSGHVAASLAAGLAVVSWLPAFGIILLGCAALIAVAATLGRYHYAIDCALGAGVAVVVWLLV